MKPGDKRYIQREKKRLMVRYGVEKTDRGAFTQNVSESGMFIRTNQVYKPGTTLQVHIKFPEREFDLWARVVWAKKVPIQLAHILPCGMGVCYLDPTIEFLEFYQDWATPFR